MATAPEPILQPTDRGGGKRTHGRKRSISNILDRDNLGDEKVILGICAMEKKARSKPMTEILKRINRYNEFEIVIFGNDMILNNPIEEWPKCHALIAFFSSGFPLQKAEKYIEYSKPQFVVNDLSLQYTLWDRSKVYKLLEMYNIPVPRHAVVRRGADAPPGDTSADTFVEHEDSIEVNGKVFKKPFLEKPISGEDHNIIIYYPSSAGGGCQRLFRKVGDRSSEFVPGVSRVRREGSYVYEDFLATEGTDVKVYTVGLSYAHAEARKAPAVDGKVTRDSDGKEIRYPVTLSAAEKKIARKVALAFKQTVCGFDMLRANGKSYVCDVNGWSFVKKSVKYYDDCAQILRQIILNNVAPRKLLVHHEANGALPGSPPRLVREGPKEGLGKSGDFEDDATEEVRCVVAVVRHGDRTPKQKLKIVTSHPKFLAFFKAHSPRRQVKLKSAVELQRVLDVVRELLSEAAPHSVASPPGVGGGFLAGLHPHPHHPRKEEEKFVEALVQMKNVLERGGHFSGINRKFQLKPKAWRIVPADEHYEGNSGFVGSPRLAEEVSEALLVLKWGGELTPAGRRQAEQLGQRFRATLYDVAEGDGTNLLQLHSTYRHDLKIYSSDEGRVQVTAAAFTKGFLDLEGEALTPILVSLVQKGKRVNAWLEASAAAHDGKAIVKARLHELMLRDGPIDEAVMRVAVPTGSYTLVNALRQIGHPQRTLMRLHELIQKLTDHLFRLQLVAQQPGGDAAVLEPYHGEKLGLMFRRWKKLEKDFYSAKDHRFNISKIPDVYDNVKYDYLHNRHLELPHLEEILKIAQPLADFVVPQEYGIEPSEKLEIGRNICGPLVGKMLSDLRVAAKCGNTDADAMGSSEAPLIPADGTAHAGETIHKLDSRYLEEELQGEGPRGHVRSRFYFTSESHLHSLINVLRYGCNTPGAPSVVPPEAQRYIEEVNELNYMTHIIFRLFENFEALPEDTKRFRVEISFSPGADRNGTDVMPATRLQTNVTLEELERFFDVNGIRSEAPQQGGSATTVPHSSSTTPVFQIKNQVARSFSSDIFSSK